MPGPFEETPSVSAILPAVYTVETLPAPSAQYKGVYAKVSNLFGEKYDLVLCSVYGSTYFWQPVRPFWARSMVVGANMTLTPLKSPSLLRLTGSLAGNRTITFDPAGAWPGCEFEIAFDGALGLYSLNILGLDLGATLGLLLGGRRRIVFDGNAYQQI
jgi:hypothetical protein